MVPAGRRPGGRPPGAPGRSHRAAGRPGCAWRLRRTAPGEPTRAGPPRSAAAGRPADGAVVPDLTSLERDHEVSIEQLQSVSLRRWLRLSGPSYRQNRSDSQADSATPYCLRRRQWAPGWPPVEVGGCRAGTRAICGPDESGRPLFVSWLRASAMTDHARPAAERQAGNRSRASSLRSWASPTLDGPVRQVGRRRVRM